MYNDNKILIGKSIGGSFGKKIGGNVGSSIVRGLFNTLIK